MAALTGSTIASTYKQLLKITSEGVGADASAKYIEDGLGTDTALSLSTTRIGIGTASPTSLVDVTGVSGGQSAVISITRHDTVKTTFPALYFKKSGNNSIGSFTTMEAFEYLGSISFQGCDDDEFREGAYIQAITTQAWSDTAAGTMLRFGTTDDDTTTVDERMRIDDNGYVGIGTTSPQSPVHIEASRVSGDVLTVKQTATSAANSHTLRCIGGEDSGDFPLRATNIDNATAQSNHIAGQHECFLVKANGCSAFNTTGNSTHALWVTRNSAGGTLYVENGFSACDSSEILIDCDFSGDNDVTGAFFMRFQDSGDVLGSITAVDASGNPAVAFNVTSDYRLKEDLKDMANATSRINNLKLYDFKWKRGDSRSDGLLAHEAAEVYSCSVSGEKDAMTKKYTYYRDGETLPDGKNYGDVKTELDVIAPQQVDYSKFVPLILKSIQELSAKITALESA
jgi:hypothetical protein